MVFSLESVVIFPVVSKVVITTLFIADLVFIAPFPLGASGVLDFAPAELFVEFARIAIGVIFDKGVGNVGAVVFIGALAEAVVETSWVNWLMTNCIVGVFNFSPLRDGS